MFGKLVRKRKGWFETPKEKMGSQPSRDCRMSRLLGCHSVDGYAAVRLAVGQSAPRSCLYIQPKCCQYCEVSHHLRWNCTDQIQIDKVKMKEIVEAIHHLRWTRKEIVVYPKLLQVRPIPEGKGPPKVVRIQSKCWQPYEVSHQLRWNCTGQVQIRVEQQKSRPVSSPKGKDKT